MQRTTRRRVAICLLIWTCAVLLSMTAAPVWAGPAAQTVPLPPDNDFLAGATELTLPGTYVIDLDLGGATWEDEEPQPGCGTPPDAVASRWYRFVMPSAGGLLVSIDSTDPAYASAIVAVYEQSGSGFDTLAQAGCSTTNYGWVFQGTANSQYVIQISTAEPRLDFSFILWFGNAEPPPPDNDFVANATEVSPPAWGVDVNLNGASLETDEPQPMCGSATHTRWFRFTAPADGRARLAYDYNMPENTGQIVMALYVQTGEGFAGLTPVACADAGALIASVTAGITYFVQMAAAPEPWQSPWTSLWVDLLPPPPPPPANDNFFDAEIHDGLFAAQVDLQGATLEDGEPQPCFSAEHTIWYKITSMVDKQFLLNQGWDSYAGVTVYSGPTLAELTFQNCGSEMYTPVGVPAGATRWIQISMSGIGGQVNLALEDAITPEAFIYANPADASRYDEVVFELWAFSFWPYPYEPFTSATWDFGDGSPTVSGMNVMHRYAQDGQYPVSVTGSTWDGRTSVNQQLFTVATHNVSIERMTTPKSAIVGNQSQVNVEVIGTDGPESVTVTLIRRDANRGDMPVGSATQWVSGLRKKGTTFAFTYSFGPEDAQNSPIQFLAVATIDGGLRDGFESDNAALSAAVAVKTGKAVATSPEEMQDVFTFTAPPTLLYLPVIEDR